MQIYKEAACATERQKEQLQTNDNCCKCDAQIKELEARIEQIRACLLELEHLTRK